MRKLYINLFVFLFGMTTATVFAFRHRLPAELVRNMSRAGAVQAAAQDPRARANFTDKEEHLLQASKERAELRTAFSKAKRVRLLSQSVRDGSLERLQLIRPQYISFLPEYRTELLPRLKMEALFQLRSRFDERDWLDWPSSALSADGRPTEARIYVDNIRLVHPELGRSLETAAQLFHGMYLSILSGSTYSLSDDLYMVLQSAEKVLALRKQTAVPARLLLDPTIIEDPSFIEVVESLRGDLFLLYQKREPDEIRTQLRLANELLPQYCASAVADGIKQLLRRLALETSTGFREVVFPEVLNSKPLSVFAAEDEGVRRALAEFYVISAIDALEAEDVERANGLLELSITTKPGLKAQTVLQKFLAVEKAQESSPVREEALLTPPSIRSERFGTRVHPGDAKGWGTVFVKLVLFALLLLGAIGSLLYIRHRRELAIVAKPGTPRGARKVAGRMTPPDDLRFDDIFEPDPGSEPRAAQG